ncbi:MAG: hypothetical protein ABMA25_03195 [Ilumatobacteraceae bacterium]
MRTTPLSLAKAAVWLGGPAKEALRAALAAPSEHGIDEYFAVEFEKVLQLLSDPRLADELR